MKSCCDQQHSIRTESSRFVDLDFVDDKIFTQKRKGCDTTNRAEIENRTAKVLFVGQDRDSTGATAFVTSGDVGRGQIVADRSSRWRPAFKFCDDFDCSGVRFEGSQKSMRRRVCADRQCALAKISRRGICSKSRYDFLFSIKNLKENSRHHQLRFVSRISASSFDAACPLSILSRAIAAAVRKSFDSPPRYSAEAAFTTTRSRATAESPFLSPFKIASVTWAFSVGPARRPSKDLRCTPKSPGEIVNVFTPELAEHEAANVSSATVTSSSPSAP